MTQDYIAASFDYKSQETQDRCVASLLNLLSSERPTFLPMSRITLGTKNHRNRTILVCVDEELHETIDELAERHGLTRSTAAYQLLSEAVKLVK
jgi:precorrin isomerase